MLAVGSEELLIHFQVILIHGLLARVTVKMMSRILNGRASMIKLLHELLLKLIIVFHAIFIIVKLRIVLRIEILLIEILVVTLQVELLLSLRSRCAIFTHGRFIVLNTSSILRVFIFAIF